MNSSEGSIENAAVSGLIAELARGIEIILALDDDEFGMAVEGRSSVGAHLRHDLDFVNAFLNGLAERRIDYNARARDARIERDRDHAIQEMAFACSRLRNLTPGLLASLVVVRSEVDEDLWHTSSASREIEFLHSHTVHHYALIAKLVAATGRRLDDEFGVAPSTLRYRESAGFYSGSSVNN
ncbi:MAG TPA: hypothetical protein VFZ23_12515 [Pyrinomonadaceae bacterium]